MSLDRSYRVVVGASSSSRQKSTTTTRDKQKIRGINIPAGVVLHNSRQLTLFFFSLSIHYHNPTASPFLFFL
jgi:hypothetical protein